MSLITCSNLSFSYENQTVVSSLNFQVNEGDYLCIVGENGTGKTTLIRGLLGLKKPSGGQLLFGDGLKSTQIGYVPQQDAVQKDFPASVYEVVLSGCLNSRGLLQRGAEEAGRRESGASWHSGSEKQEFPGAFRRSAPAGASCPFPVRGGTPASAG